MKNFSAHLLVCHARPYYRGSTFLLTLFFAALFLVMFSATLSYIMVQHKAVEQQAAYTQALNLAEAGVHYYRWHLAHSPTDYTTDTGVRQLENFNGENFGTYNLSVTAPEAGSTTAIITSLGYPTATVATMARVRVRYGRPSLARYAFMSNSNVWFGDTEEISGLLHSNGGVRMDGIGTSLLTSAKETYICGEEHGCSNQWKPGVWGEGQKPEYWQFPVPAIDFGTLTLNLDDIKTAAQDDGIFLSSSGKYGYYIVFKNTGKLDVNKVTALQGNVDAYDGSEWVTLNNEKKTWSIVSGYQNIPVPANGLIYAEDDLWVSGEIKGRITIAAARPVNKAPANIYIQEDITYTARDGSNVLGLIAQQDLLVPLRSDNVLEIDGALVAINGQVFRYFYSKTNKDPYKTYALRDKIETYGIIISNGMWTWSWVSEAGGPVTSGYKQTETTYDPDLTYGPPPSFPTEDEYAFISWEELTLTQE